MLLLFVYVVEKDMIWSVGLQALVSTIVAGCPLVVLAGAAGYRFHPG